MKQFELNRSVGATIGWVILAALVLIVTVSTVSAQSGTIVLTGNQTATIQCEGRRLNSTRISDTEFRLTCLPHTQTATPVLPTATRTPTRTPIASTPTAIPPTATALPQATATSQPGPTATPVVQAGQPCPTWVHDRHVTTGPDGNSYPTWHPPVDPTYGCTFSHDHGVDPRTSSVNSTMPAFGYVGTQGGMSEAHGGFKVFNFECGESGDQGQNRIAARYVMHMGTSGTMRFHMAFHSVHYSARACDGSWSIDVMGMADFGTPIGSICDEPRRGGRDFSTIGCVSQDHPEKAYEIWSGTLEINHPNDLYTGLFQSRAYVSIVPAVFDPVTTLNPNNHSEIVYTTDIVYPGQYDPLSTQSPFRGCHLEAYHGPVSLNNAGRPQTYVTDVYGNILPNAQPGTPGTLTQTISSVRVEGSGSNASANGTQFKKEFNLCNPYITAPN